MTVIQTRSPARPRRVLSRLASLLAGRRTVRNARPLRDRSAPRARGDGDPGDARTMILPAIPMFHGDGRRSPLGEAGCTDLWIRPRR